MFVSHTLRNNWEVYWSKCRTAFKQRYWLS